MKSLESLYGRTLKRQESFAPLQKLSVVFMSGAVMVLASYAKQERENQEKFQLGVYSQECLSLLCRLCTQDSSGGVPQLDCGMESFRHLLFC